MGKLILYGMEESPPVRAVLLTLNALGLDYDFKVVNLLTGENKSPEFIKKNPQHTVPVLDDNGQFIWDSHVIAAYLVRKFAKNDALYPKDFHQRAIVDQRLHFDSGVLFPSLRNMTGPLFFQNATSISQENIDAAYNNYNFLEAFLEQDFLAGNTMTIADLSMISTVSTLAYLAPVVSTKTPKLAAWISRLTKLPYYEEANGKGAAVLHELVKSKLVSN